MQVFARWARGEFSADLLVCLFVALFWGSAGDLFPANLLEHFLLALCLMMFVTELV